MEFGNNQAIYLQIADRIGENILTGQWREGDRLPSVRELAAMIEVNPNTVIRSYGYLQEQEIIHNRRGIGYFVSEGASARILEIKRRNFVRHQLPGIFRSMDLLGMSCAELEKMYREYQANKEKSA